MYKVKVFFTDLQDHGHAYHVGDTYPREGLEPTAERIAELSGKDNRQGKVLIHEVKEEKKTAKPKTRSSAKKTSK